MCSLITAGGRRGDTRFNHIEKIITNGEESCHKGASNNAAEVLAEEYLEWMKAAEIIPLVVPIDSISRNAEID